MPLENSEHGIRGRASLEFFWEQADLEESAEHPLERELCDHLDALARYGRLLDDAYAAGREDAVRQLIRQHDRAEQRVQLLREALLRMREERHRGAA